jgi:hypothetical protein
MVQELLQQWVWRLIRSTSRSSVVVSLTTIIQVLRSYVPAARRDLSPDRSQKGVCHPSRFSPSLMHGLYCLSCTHVVAEYFIAGPHPANFCKGDCFQLRGTSSTVGGPFWTEGECSQWKGFLPDPRGWGQTIIRPGCCSLFWSGSWFLGLEYNDFYT